MMQLAAVPFCFVLICWFVFYPKEGNSDVGT